MRTTNYHHSAAYLASIGQSLPVLQAIRPGALVDELIPIPLVNFALDHHNRITINDVRDRTRQEEKYDWFGDTDDAVYVPRHDDACVDQRTRPHRDRSSRPPPTTS